jgi:NADH-quinone oxidoreductase subunit C
MRKYTPKDNVQKQSYYTDRFRAPDRIPEDAVDACEVSAKEVEELTKAVKVEKAYIQRGQLIVIVDAKDAFSAVKSFKTQGYAQLSEMSAIDYIAQKGGFEIFYQLLSLSKAKRVRVKCFIKDGDKIESVTQLYNSANWAEREMYDLFGIVVNNHPLLKRIMMPEDWTGHPLRKSYPLQGDENASWYEVDKIYGKEAREIIGEELRDAAYVDRYDTTRFARIGKEVGLGMPYSETETPIKYQESDRPPLIEKFDPSVCTEASRDR